MTIKRFSTIFVAIVTLAIVLPTNIVLAQDTVSDGSVAELFARAQTIRPLAKSEDPGISQVSSKLTKNGKHLLVFKETTDTESRITEVGIPNFPKMGPKVATERIRVLTLASGKLCHAAAASGRSVAVDQQAAVAMAALAFSTPDITFEVEHVIPSSDDLCQSYDEDYPLLSGDGGSHTRHLRFMQDHFVDELFDRYHVDLIGMEVADPGDAGRAFLKAFSRERAFFTFADLGALGPFGGEVIAHEIGHNLGARHDRHSFTTPPSGTAFAWGWCGADGKLHRTVTVASNLGLSCPVVGVVNELMFSNPDMGTGTPDDNNVWDMNVHAAVVANLTPPPPVVEECVPDARTQCHLDGRFRVRANFWLSGQEADPRVALAVTANATDRSSYWHYGNPVNSVLITGVLPGCSSFGRYWAQYGGPTDVGLAITVEDLVAGVSQTYGNDAGQGLVGEVDKETFATCHVNP